MAINDAPPSVLYVHDVLSRADEWLTIADLAERTEMKERTCRFGIKRLRHRGLVESRTDPQEARRELHRLDPAI